ncbi:MAG: family 20 glycosylhydrolase, partial [Tannerellaceae bacterium]
DHGWQDAGEVTSTLSKSSIVHFWKGEEDLFRDAVSKGYDIVNSTHNYTYLDYDYNSIPLEKAYNFNPIPKGIKPEQESQVLGLGCQMWGEWIPTVESMNQRVYPRIAAYAEVGWTKAENKDYTRFTAALDGWKATWKKLGINYHE